MGAAAAMLVVAGTAFVTAGLVSHPSSRPIVTKTAIGCLEPAIVLTGAISGCAGVVEGLSCPSGPFEAARVVHLRSSSADFILYLEVDGGYHGPGTYDLAPWPHDSLGTGDDVAKVAIREWISGRLWESVGGSMTIDNSERDGTVDADLRVDSRSDALLHIHGPWTCP